jgi:hypothetical protein
MAKGDQLAVPRAEIVEVVKNALAPMSEEPTPAIGE